MTLLQYAKSTDREVVETVQRNTDNRQAAIKRCAEWAEAHGSNNGAFYPATGFGGQMGIHGLPFLMGVDGEGMPPASWVRGKLPPDGRRPRRGTAEAKEMEALRWVPEMVPGAPDYCESKGDVNGSFYWMTPAPFVHDDAAWVLLGHQPTRGDFGEQWVEVKASEAYAAKEAYADDAKAAS